MGLRDIVSQLFGRTESDQATSSARFIQTEDSVGALFILQDGGFSDLEQGEASAETTAQFILLTMLQEQGLASRLAHGFSVPVETVVSLGFGDAQLLDLPATFDKPLSIEFESTTPNSTFQTYAMTSERGRDVQVTGRGGILSAGGTRYRATAGQWAAVAAVRNHTALSTAERTESANTATLGELLAAADIDDRIEVSFYSDKGWNVATPSDVGVSGVVEANGDLILSPVLDVAVEPHRLDRRLTRAVNHANSQVLRIDTQIISLDDSALAAVSEVLSHRRIPADQVKQFLKTPSAFLDAALVNLDLGFSVRVEGVGFVRHLDFDDPAGSGIDWFADDSALNSPDVLNQLLLSEEDIASFETHLSSAAFHGATSVHFADTLIDISNRDEVDRQIARAREQLDRPRPLVESDGADSDNPPKISLILRDAAQVNLSLTAVAADAIRNMVMDLAPLKRHPFPHQTEGVEWIFGLIRAAHAEDQSGLYRLQGALLADDMGLGKTYMALAAIAQHTAEIRNIDGAGSVRPTLVVAPLSLLENWEAEVAATFKESPFSDIVVLQTERDLRKFTRDGEGRETTQTASIPNDAGMFDEKQLRLSLRVGASEGQRRLDQPGRLVLTTYDTLRDYQFSMAQIDWGVVVFDEAQAIKNPNAMRTRAAKGLRAIFKLVTTGTPVENSLGDFWCLVDTAQPGLLGTWDMFRDTWILPVQQSDPEDRDAIRLERGKSLRDAVGPFMLRRLKEDHLEGLPTKTVHSPFDDDPQDPHHATLAQTMPQIQRDVYDEILRARRSAPSDESNHPLAVLTRLRVASLHPSFAAPTAKTTWPSTRAIAYEQIAQSGKLIGLLKVLDAIKVTHEKAIIFVTSKDLQLLLAMWVQQIYGFRPHIINGDTSAISKGAGRSRRQLIEDFESVSGFNVIIMSPVAAGTGLTVIGANHVIHLERHWNPAKEAQATDRAYRIGQTRPVHVYLPASIHPDRESFDKLLNRLHQSKTAIKDAVMDPGEITSSDLFSVFSFDQSQ